MIQKVTIRRKVQSAPEDKEPVDEITDRLDKSENSISPAPVDESRPEDERPDGNVVVPNNDLVNVPEENVDNEEPGQEPVGKLNGIEQPRTSEEIPEGDLHDETLRRRKGIPGSDTESKVPVERTLKGREVTEVKPDKIIQKGTIQKKGQGFPEENVSVDEITDRQDISEDRIPPVPVDESRAETERPNENVGVPHDNLVNIPEENVDDKEPGQEQVGTENGVEEPQPTEEFPEGDQPDETYSGRKVIPGKDTESKVPVEATLISPAPDDESRPEDERPDGNDVVPIDNLVKVPKENIDGKEPRQEPVGKPNSIEEPQSSEEIAEGDQADETLRRRKRIHGSNTESKVPVKRTLKGRKVTEVKPDKIIQKGTIQKKGQGVPQENVPVDEITDRPEISEDRISPVPVDESRAETERPDENVGVPKDNLVNVPEENVNDKEPGQEQVGTENIVEEPQPTEEFPEGDQPDKTYPGRKVIPGKNTESKVPVEGTLKGRKVTGVKRGKMVQKVTIRRKVQSAPEDKESVDEITDRPDKSENSISPVPIDENRPEDERPDGNVVVPNNDLVNVPEENVDDEEPGQELVGKPNGFEEPQTTEEIAEGDRPDETLRRRKLIPGGNRESKVPVEGTLKGRKVTGVKRGKMIQKVTIRRKGQGVPEDKEPVDEMTDRQDISEDRIPPVPVDESKPEAEGPDGNVGVPNVNLVNVPKKNVDDKEPGQYQVGTENDVEDPQPTEEFPEGDQPDEIYPGRKVIPGKGTESKMPVERTLKRRKVTGVKSGKMIQKVTIRRKVQSAPEDKERVDEITDRPDKSENSISPVPVDESRPEDERPDENFVVPNDNLVKIPKANVDDKEPRQESIGARGKGSIKGNLGSKKIFGVIKRKVSQRGSLKTKAIGQAVFGKNGSSDERSDITIDDMEPGEVEGSYGETEDLEQDNVEHVLSEGTTDVKRSRRGKQIPRKRVGGKGIPKRSLNIKRIPVGKRVGSGVTGGSIGGNIVVTQESPDGILFNGDFTKGKGSDDYGFGQKRSIKKGLKESIIATIGRKGVVAANLVEDGILTTTRRRKQDFLNEGTTSINEVNAGSSNAINLKFGEGEPRQGSTDENRQNAVIPKHMVLLGPDTGPKVANGVITAGKGTPGQVTKFGDGNSGESKWIDGTPGENTFENTADQSGGRDRVIVVNTQPHGSVRDDVSRNQAAGSDTKSIIGRDRVGSVVQEDKSVGVISLAKGRQGGNWFAGGEAAEKGRAGGSVGGSIINVGSKGGKWFVDGGGSGKVSTGGSFGVNSIDASNQGGKWIVKGGADGNAANGGAFLGNRVAAQGGKLFAGGGANGQGDIGGFSRENEISAGSYGGKWFGGEKASVGMTFGGNDVHLGSTGGKWVDGGDADGKGSTGGSFGGGVKAEVSQGGKWFVGGDSQGAGIPKGSEGRQWFTGGSTTKKGTKEAERNIQGSIAVGQKDNSRKLGEVK